MKNKALTVGLQCLQENDAKGGVPRYEALLKNKLEEHHKIDLKIVKKVPKNIKQFKWLAPLIQFLPLILPKPRSILLSVNFKTSLFVLPSIPRIITVHDLFYLTVPQFVPFSRKTLSRLLLPVCLKLSDIIIVPSRCTKNDIIKYFPKYENKIRVVPLAGDLIHVKYCAPNNPDLRKLKDYFLFIGKIEQRKNLINLLNAYESLPSTLQNRHKLVIAGEQGWGGVDILSEAKKLELDRHVILINRPSDNEVIFLYKNALCLALPSFYEGFGLPIIEAQQFGLPVITSTISSMPEIAGDGAIFIEPESIESIAEGLKRIATDFSLRGSLSKKAKKNSAKYSWDNSIEKIIDIILEINARME